MRIVTEDNTPETKKYHAYNWDQHEPRVEEECESTREGEGIASSDAPKPHVKVHGGYALRVGTKTLPNGPDNEVNCQW